MEIKILQVFYDKNGLPYKDKERTVHYPITSGTFLGASNTTQIRFYYDQLDELNESTFVAVSKLPNGKIGSEILESEYDSELQENYATLNLSQFYTQYKGDVYISLQGYQGGVRVEQDEDGIYQIYGTPTIQATGSIKLSIAYAPTFVGSGQTENITLQRVLAELSTKLGIRQETLHVEELPTVGNPNVWYVINDDPSDATKANIYIWNATTQTYVWVGDNTLDLGNYYTQEQGDQFESGIDNRITNVENELESVASGSPKGVYSTLADLQAAYPTGTTGIYVVSADGHWYYWNGSAWTDGGVYLSTVDAVPDTRKVSNIPLESDISPDDLTNALTKANIYTSNDLVNAFLENSENKFDITKQTPQTISPHYYVNGVPYETTQYDNLYNCTALFEISPNTTYYIKTFNFSPYDKPWGGASYGIFFYDKNGNYISGENTSSFTTPANAKFARFNYYIGAGTNLDFFKENTMLVYGSSEPSSFVSYKHKTAIEKIAENQTNIQKNTGLSQTIGDELTDFEIWEDYENANAYDYTAWNVNNITVGKWYKDGVEITQSNTGHTGFFEILPNTQYTVGLIPVYGGCTLPSYSLDVVMSFFDDDKNYLGQVLKTQPTFTTPKGTKYTIVNFVYGTAGISFSIVNDRCAIYKGSSLPQSLPSYLKPFETKEKIKDNSDRLDDYDEKLYTYQQIDNLEFVSGTCWSKIINDFYTASWDYTIIDLSEYDIKSFNARTVTNSACPGIVFFNGDPLNGGTYISYLLLGPSQDAVNEVSAENIEIPNNCTHVLFQYATGYGSRAYILGKQFINVDNVNNKNIIYAAWDKTLTKLTANVRFDASRDLCVELGKRGPNNIFDFKKWSFISNEESTHYPLSLNSGVTYANNGTDFFGPWIISAVNNKDGDNPGSGNFTGGNHGYDNTGSTSNNSATGRTVSVEVRIDGNLCNSFAGYCSRIDIYWVNRVQAYNTTKQDGSGREVLEERYHLSFDGHTWKVEGNPIALEDIKVITYYGLQFAAFGSVNSTNKLEYYGDDKDSTYNANANSQANSKNCLGEIYSDIANNFKCKIFVNNVKGLGRNVLNRDTSFSFFYASYGKGYANFIRNSSGETLDSGVSMYFEGSYNFEPILDGD